MKTLFSQSDIKELRNCISALKGWVGKSDQGSKTSWWKGVDYGASKGEGKGDAGKGPGLGAGKSP